jgi:hypothetical protein
MKVRPYYIATEDAEAGMETGAPVAIVNSSGILSFSLPAGHKLTEDNLRQLAAHHGEYIFVLRPDPRSDEQVAIDAAAAARRVMEVFAGADLADPLLAVLFDRVLAYRSA